MNELEHAKRLSDEALISKLSRCVREDRELSARLLANLGEVDARELYRDQGFSSMFDYCVRSLHLSESEADLRIKAARIGRRFPSALEMLARGELHMTALRLLAPVLTTSNVYLLNEACFKSKFEVKELIAKHFPAPDVAESMRRLPRPRSMPIGQEPQLCELSQPTAVPLQLAVAPMQHAAQLAGPQQHHSIQPSGAPLLAFVPPPLAKNKPAVTAPLSEGRYSVQFTASQSLYDKLKEARDLCCDDVPNGEMATIVEQALVLLIARKKKQRFALTSRPRKQWLPRSSAHASSMKRDDEVTSKRPADGVRNPPREAERSSAKREGGRSNDRPPEERSLPRHEESKPSSRCTLSEERSLAECEKKKPDSRYIPSALRREVYARDGGQCSFVSQSGTRCCTRRDLEFHHIVPFARGGATTRDNLCLMCRAHNALLAERDYGRDYVKSRVAKRQEAVSHRTNRTRSGRSGRDVTVTKLECVSTSVTTRRRGRITAQQ